MLNFAMVLLTYVVLVIVPRRITLVDSGYVRWFYGLRAILVCSRYRCSVTLPRYLYAIQFAVHHIYPPLRCLHCLTACALLPHAHCLPRTTHPGYRLHRSLSLYRLRLYHYLSYTSAHPTLTATTLPRLHVRAPHRLHTVTRTFTVATLRAGYTPSHARVLGFTTPRVHACVAWVRFYRGLWLPIRGFFTATPPAPRLPHYLPLALHFTHYTAAIHRLRYWTHAFNMLRAPLRLQFGYCYLRACARLRRLFSPPAVRYTAILSFAPHIRGCCALPMPALGYTSPLYAPLPASFHLSYALSRLPAHSIPRALLRLHRAAVPRAAFTTHWFFCYSSWFYGFWVGSVILLTLFSCLHVTYTTFTTLPLRWPVCVALHTTVPISLRCCYLTL